MQSMTQFMKWPAMKRDTVRRLRVFLTDISVKEYFQHDMYDIAKVLS
jgi:hypothetical protein